MKSESLVESETFRKCADFHGHICPGLSIGFKAARAAMRRLNETRSEDEEIVAIVGTDACCVDAVQVLTGCTFGKGNFIHRDHGKMVLTLLSRNSGAGVRVALKPGTLPVDREHAELQARVLADDATEAEEAEYRRRHHARSREILDTPEERLFDITPARVHLPPKARIEPSVACVRCGEPTMSSRLISRNGERLCRECAGPGEAAR